MDLSVVVVTHESRDHVLACLRSLPSALGTRRLDADPLCWECVVVDNDSRDGGPELVEREATWAKVVRTGANLGYAKAVNRGLAVTTGSHVLVSNPDCVWAPASVAELAAWLDSHPRCALAAPRIRNPDGSLEYSARAYPGPFAFLFNRYSLLSRLFPGNPWTRRYLMLDWDHAAPRSVDWVSGAAMLVRREAADTVGGMDEAFFMFNEDVDWCRRMNQAGWTVDYVPAAEVVHHIGASERTSNRVILERHRGMLHYFRKHHRAPALVDAVVALVVMSRARLLMALNRRGR